MKKLLGVVIVLVALGGCCCCASQEPEKVQAIKFVPQDEEPETGR